MGNPELREITAIGDIVLSNGRVNRQSAHADFEKVLGKLISEGDYQPFTFYSIEGPIMLSDKEIMMGLIFKRGEISWLNFHLSDKEISGLTSRLSIDNEKIVFVTETLRDLLQIITKGQGDTVKGRRYFKRYSWGYCDIVNPTRKWPSITMNYRSD